MGYSPTIISQKIKNLRKAKAINNDTISKRKFNMTYLRKEKIPKIDNQIIKLLKQGKTITEIAKTLGLTIALIFKRIRILQKIGILTQDIIEQNPDLAYLKKNKVTINDDSISEQKYNKTPFSNYIKKANLISSLNYEHSFFSKAFRQARAINDLGKLTQEDVDILAKALLIELPTLENVINISRLYVNVKQYQKCIMFLEQSREFFNEEQKSKINELLLEIKTTIKNNQKKQDRNRQIERN